MTKAALLAAVWSDLAVSDSMPAICVNELCKALADRAAKPRFIETVHRRGYRFVAKVTTAKGREANRGMLLLEDLHWSDFSTLELISAIARRVESARLMIVGTYRLVESLANDHPMRTMQQELELHRYCEVMRLKLLNEGDVEDYLSRRLAGDDGRKFGTLAPIIHTRTDGNPLFMVNMIDYLWTDSGLLARLQQVTEAEWAVMPRVQWLDAPHSIRQMKLTHG